VALTDFTWHYWKEKINNMKKNFTLISFLLYSFISWAQIPAGYYNTATGTGLTLKTQLKKIIDDVNDGLTNERLSTDPGYAGLYTTYQTSDVKTNGSVWDMYSNCDFIFGTVASGGQQDNGTNPSGECQLFNREHTVPQSYFGNSVQPMYSDAHFVIPSDKIVNATRDDFPYGRVGTPTYTSGNGSKKGNNLNSGYSAGYSLTVFEPIDQYKGDIARIMFYFVTRYESQLNTFFTSSNSTSKIMFDGSTGKSFSDTFLNIFITWHIQDPVSQKEIDRNNAIFARQNNRNPFIDTPAYVCQIWSTQCAALSSENFVLKNTISIYPNPAVNNEVSISSEKELKSIVLYNINGQIIQEIKNPSKINDAYKVSNLPKGFYLLQLASDNELVTRKIMVD
jgi:endonuclease I